MFLINDLSKIIKNLILYWSRDVNLLEVQRVAEALTNTFWTFAKAVSSREPTISRRSLEIRS